MANGLSCPPGMSIAGFQTVGGDPRVILGLWSSLIGREHVQPQNHHIGGVTMRRLFDLAYGRSGDKGNIANVSVIARAPEPPK